MAAQNVQSRCMPVTRAAFQINTAEAGDSAEEDFSAVIRLTENLAGLYSHKEERVLVNPRSNVFERRRDNDPIQSQWLPMS